MDRNKKLSKSIARASLKNLINEMKSFSLLDIYDEDSVEAKHYTKLKDNFFHLFNHSKLQEKRYATGKEAEFYIDWVLHEMTEINDNDQWIIHNGQSYQGCHSHCYALLKGSNKLDNITDLWNMQKYKKKLGIGNSGFGVDLGFFAINKTIGVIAIMGVFSHDEHHYTLATLEIEGKNK